jgi:Calcineurin-like phosphoesterase superfamily domain
LRAVVADLRRRGVERVLHGGDLVLMGPRPAEVVDLVAELGWEGVVGNTDEVLWRPGEHERQLARAPKLAPLLDLVFREYAPVTRAALGEARVTWLRELRVERRVGDWAIVHAAPGDLWRAPAPDADDEALADVYGPLGAHAIYGHIHRPFVRRLEGGVAVANAGSVGMPWDGDPRASYLLVECDRAEVVRVAYDVEAETRALHAAHHPDARRLAEMRRRGSFVAPADR